MKKISFAVILSLCLGCGPAMASSPFAVGDVEIGQTGIVDISPVAAENVDALPQDKASARMTNLEKAVDRYIYLLELLKKNPEVARSHADQMASLKKMLTEKIAKEVDAGIHLIAGYQLNGEPLAEDHPLCKRNRELLSLYGELRIANDEFARLLQSDIPVSSSEPINQADADYIAEQQKTEDVASEKHEAINEIRYGLSRLREKIYAGASNDDLTLTLNWLKKWFSEAEKNGVEIPDHLRKEYDKLLVAARQQIADQKKQADPQNLLNDFVYGTKMLAQRIAAGESAQQINATLNWTTESLNRAKAAGVEIPQHLLNHFEELRKKVPAPPKEGVLISDRGKQQMAAVIDYARSNNGGYSGGDCFEFVWRYLYRSGYGNISKYNDLPHMQSDWARHFSDFLNASPANLDEAGLQRLDTAFKPPITNPHDPRIPKGAVIVVAPDSYGTAHRYAGDIVIKAGEGHFINDGPRMNYGTRSTWYGKVLGVYVPR